MLKLTFWQANLSHDSQIWLHTSTKVNENGLQVELRLVLNKCLQKGIYQ